MRRLALASSLLAPLVFCPLLQAQQVRFFHERNLAAVAPDHSSLDAAMRHLCRGPDAGERALGYYSQLPAGTKFVSSALSGSSAHVVFDERLLQAAAGANLEDAIEQIDKTALAHVGVDRVTIGVRMADGSELPLALALHERTPPPPTASLTTPSALILPYGTLSGRRIAISPGHGYYWHTSLGWTTQRGDIGGLIEDIHTAEICNRFLIPFLRNMGADVISCREQGEVTSDAVVDNDAGAPAYVETGAWFTSGATGYQGSTYRYASSTNGPETATATWQLPVAQDGLYPVYAWFGAGTNRTPEALYRVHHSGGVTECVVDQTVDDKTWAHIGTFWFSANDGATVVLSNSSPQSGVVIADAMRLGGGVGSIVRGGTTSNQARWRECSRYWLQFSGAPSSVYDSQVSGQDNGDDVTARPRFAEWRGADAFVSIHTNAGGGAGTSSFIYSGGATAGSSTLQQRIHTQIIGDLQSEWSAGWVDRGQQQANFGEVRLLSTMPGVLLELAFHDTDGSFDHDSIHDPKWRYLVARAVARGVLRYFSPAAPFPPEPPAALRITQDGNRGLLVAWDAAAGATHYTIEASSDGKGFTEVGDVTGTNWSTGPLPHHAWSSFRVRAWNSTGRSFPTEVLTAGTDHLGTAQALLVQGFDRLSRTVKSPENTRDYLHRFGDALRREARFSLGFDAASNEAVKLGRVQLADYDAVIWSLGEESTADETFDAQEQSLVTSYITGGGGLIVTGAEVGWDLDALGSASDRSFFRNVLGATYVADDAGTYGLQAGVAGTVSEGIGASSFDNGNGPTYDVDYADVLTPTTGSGTICLRYNNGLGAGVQTVNALFDARIVVFGLPLDTMLDANARAQLLQQSVAFVLDGDMQLRGPSVAVMGQPTPFALSMPGEAGMPYLCALSESYFPGTVLPLGGLFPLNNGLILEISITPGSPFFPDFLGALDAAGNASPTFYPPVLPFLNGLDLFVSAFTISPQMPVEREISNWLRVKLTL